MERGFFNFGHDESNNGSYPEIHAAIFSDIALDTTRFPEIIEKQRDHSKIFERLNLRDYRFLIFQQKDKKRIKQYQKMGRILASLLYDEFDKSKITHLNLFLDGDKGPEELKFMFDFISSKFKLDSQLITIKYGLKFDRLYPIVHMADQYANYLRYKNLDELVKDSHLKELIL
jgi:hypothetical protein